MNKPKQLTLSIALGDDAMRNFTDALEHVARALEDSAVREDGDGGSIYDANGGIVGFWEVS